MKTVTTPDRPLRILVTCRDLARREGSQLYTRDLAEELRELGHTPVVFSSRLGEVAEEIRSRGVAVVDHLDRLGEAPDVIHGQHHLEAMTAVLRFPQTPALFVCHGWLPWQEAAPLFPSILRYVAVDELRRDRLVFEHGIPETKVSVILNFVDLERFQPRPPLPARPQKALIFSNHATGSHVDAVRAACLARGLDLQIMGIGNGPEARPQDRLPDYDLVFARGRSALEAMAVGCAVVLCDQEGCGPLVDSRNFTGLRALNFGVGALRPPVERHRLEQEIERYDAEEAARVRERVRREAGRREAVRCLVALYQELDAERDSLAGLEHQRRCLTAASDYLRWVAPRLDPDFDIFDWQGAVGEAERLRLAGDEALRRSEERLAAERATLGEAEAARRELEGRLQEARAELALLMGSPFYRVRSRLLRIRPLVASYRWIRSRLAAVKLETTKR